MTQESRNKEYKSIELVQIPGFEECGEIRRSDIQLEVFVLLDSTILTTLHVVNMKSG